MSQVAHKRTRPTEEGHTGGKRPKTDAPSSVSSSSSLTTNDHKPRYEIVLCYLYHTIPDPGAIVLWFVDLCTKLSLTGRVLVATEGINVNLAGLETAASPDGHMAALQAAMDAHPQLGGGGQRTIDYKLDVSDKRPFPDLKAQHVKEIVATGNSMPFELLSQQQLGGQHLSPQDFHKVLQTYMGSPTASPTDSENPENQEVKIGEETVQGRQGEDGRDETDHRPLVLIDVRNRKEIEFGKFAGSVNSNTKMFSEWARHFALPRVAELKKSKVLMYCTGGVRCEKASAFLRSKGVEDVSQLSGGIHRYLEQYGSGGFFKGSNFVFDSRGLQRPEGADVVAKCGGCGCLEETLSSDRVCAVCRDQVIVCDVCRKEKRGVYFCKGHKELEGSYYPFLDNFDSEELARQRETLSGMVQAKGIYGGKAHRNRRKSLHKQIKRLEEQERTNSTAATKTTQTTQTTQTQTSAGNTTEEGAQDTQDTLDTPPDTPRATAVTSNARCRSCGRPCASLRKLLGLPVDDKPCCKGDCWGFFQPARREEGYVKL